MIQGAWGWCTGMTQREGMEREVGGGFRMGNTKIIFLKQNAGSHTLSLCSLNISFQSNIPSSLKLLLFIRLI